jgi:hypothetical protein
MTKEGGNLYMFSTSADIFSPKNIFDPQLNPHMRNPDTEG